MSLTNFPEPQDLDVSFVDRTGDSRPKSFNKYDVSNPHPGFGKDPNILNEFGHTKFPMWADSKTVVNNQKELDAFNAARNPALKTDGPTVAEYVAAGYKASSYPPSGYASKSTKEEIDAAIKLEVPAAGGWGTK